MTQHIGCFVCDAIYVGGRMTGDSIIGGRHQQRHGIIDNLMACDGRLLEISISYNNGMTRSSKAISSRSRSHPYNRSPL